MLYPTGPSTPNIYPNWLTNAFVTATACGNFYNTNDYALGRSIWETDEAFKPDDQAGINPPYGYRGLPTDDPPMEDGFWSTYKLVLQQTLHLGSATNLEDRYEIFSFAAEARCRALGTTPNAAGFSAQNLWTVLPPDAPGHSYELHSFARDPVDIVRGKPFSWKLVLGVPQGGLTKSQDLYQNEAPAGGYLHTVAIETQATSTNWTSSFEGEYYLESRASGVFGRLKVHFTGDYQPPPTHFEIDAYLNSQGSRNLEIDPAKLTRVGNGRTGSN